MTACCDMKIQMIQKNYLRVARIVTIAASVFLIVLFVLNLALAPRYAAELAETWTPNITWTPEQTRAALTALGWSPVTMVYVFKVLIPLFGATFSIALGLLVFARKSNDAFGLFVAFVFVFTGTNNASHDALLRAVPALQGLYGVLSGLSWQFSFIIFYLFPDGRFVPRWTRWLLLGWLGVNVLGGFSLALDTAMIVIPVILVFSTLFSQIYRYFFYADTIGRQQTKWVLYGILLEILLLPFAMLPFLLPNAFVQNGATGLVWTLVLRGGIGITSVIIPLSITFGILRYRLFDIDIIIRRTVTYAIVVALLLLVYFGSVILLQQVFASVTGQRSEIITIVSTLAIAAMFVPLRNRVQNAIDKRFNRKKYDAAQVLQKFAETVRDETDLDKLNAELLNVVNETMQPKSVSLWLRQEQRRKQDG